MDFLLIVLIENDVNENNELDSNRFEQEVSFTQK